MLRESGRSVGAPAPPPLPRAAAAGEVDQAPTWGVAAGRPAYSVLALRTVPNWSQIQPPAPSAARCQALGARAARAGHAPANQITPNAAATPGRGQRAGSAGSRTTWTTPATPTTTALPHP